MKPGIKRQRSFRTYNPRRYKRPRQRRKRRLRNTDHLGVELKFLDCAWNQEVVANSTDGSGGELHPTSGCTNCISCPAQGDTGSTRDGRTYVIKSIWVTGVLDEDPQADLADPKEGFGTFFALVLDKQANGATITSENVYINPSTLNQGMIPHPFRNLAQSRRYKILDSQYVDNKGMYGFNDNAGTTNFTGSIITQTAGSVNLNWKGTIQVETKGTTANVTSVVDNAVHLLAFKGSAATTSFIGKSRVRFIG